MGKVLITCMCYLMGIGTSEPVKDTNPPVKTEQQSKIASSCDIEVEAGDEVVLCNGMPGQLNGSVSGNYTSVEWSPADGLSSTTILNPTVSVTDETTYTLTVNGIGDNLIENGDFESGDISPSTSSFSYVDPGSFTGGSSGDYTVGNSGSILFLTGLCDGHTGPEMMVTNGGGTDVWCQSVNVEPNTDYKLEVWVGGVEILFLANSSVVDVKINGSILGSISGSAFCDWNVFQTVWNSGPNATADICLNTSGGNSDYALIDDISFKECCVITDEVTVYPEEVEAVILPPDTIKCDNHPILLNGTLSTNKSGYTYEWTTSDGEITGGGNTLTPEVDKRGTYTLTVTGPRGCTHTATEFVEGNTEPPIVGFVSANLDCMHDSAIVFIDTMFIPDLRYTWKGPNGFTSNQQKDTLYVPGKYAVTVTDRFNCETEDTIYVKDLRTQADFTINIDSLNCQSDSAKISLDIPDSLARVNWIGPNGFSSIERLITVGESGQYIVLITDSLDCPYSDTIQVDDNRVFPNILVDSDTITCAQPFSNLFGHSDSTNVSFHWTGPNGFNDNNPSTTTTDTGWHYLEVIMADGCSRFDSVFVIKDGDIPSLTIMGDTLTCDQDEIDLEGITNDPNATIMWTGPKGFSNNNLIVTVRDSGKYELTIENAQGCKITKTYIVVSEMDLPEVTILGDDQINCKDEMVTLIANDTMSGIASSWTTKKGVLSIQNKINVDKAGWYYLNKVDGNGCIGIDSILVTVDTTKPDFTLFADTINCRNNQPRVGINNNDTDGGWLWYNETTMTYTRPDTNLNVTKEGWYKVRVFKSNFCSTIDSVLVAIDTISPIISVQDDSLTCSITKLNLTANVANGYASIIWTGPNGFNSDQLQPEVTEEGIYNVIVTAQNGCVTTAQIKITLEGTLPDIKASSDSLDCNKTSVILSGSSATNGAQFVWSGPNGFNSNDPNPSVQDSGWYELTVIGEGGCKVKRRVYVGLDNEKPIESWDADTITCLQTTVDINSTGTTNNYTYNWSGPNGFNSNIQNNTVSDAGSYTVIIKGDNGCEQTVNIDVEEDIILPTISALDDTLSCATNMAILNFTTTNTNYATEWTGPNGFNSTDKNPLVSEVGSYNIHLVDNDNGCASDFTVNVFPPNAITAFHTTKEGECESNTVQLIIDQIEGGRGPFLYSFNGATLQSDNNFEATPGEVEVTIEDSQGCRYTEKIQIDNIDNIEGAIIAEVTLNKGEKYNILASTNRDVQDIASITWSPDEDLSCSDCLNPTVTATQDKTYTVVIIDNFGCEITLEIRILVKVSNEIFVPNTFSPNGDAINDRFTIFTPNGSEAKIVNFQIFSRWGESVFLLQEGQTNDPLNGWDGKFKNENVLPGVYVYKAKIVWPTGETKLVDGSVTIVR